MNPAGTPNWLTSASSPYNAAIRSVACRPGCTELTVIPCAAISRATVFKKPVTPARAVFERIRLAIGWRTESDVMATMRPHCCCCIIGIAA